MDFRELDGLRERLYQEVRKIGLETTEQNVINSISEGVAEELVLRLQRICLDNDGMDQMNCYFPFFIIQAIVNYKKQQSF